MKDTHGSEQHGEFHPGTILDGRYKLISELGEGGFARVYKAQHIHMDRMVAIKLMSASDDQPIAFTAHFRERFLREAKAVAAIQHPNVVMTYDFGFAGIQQVPYMVMELLEGHDLDTELSWKGPIQPDRALKLFSGSLAGLAEAHKQGIVHRDIKPSNLFMKHPGTSDETMSVLDFGIAGAHDPVGPSADPVTNVSRLTSVGQILGTPQYLAPEFIRYQITTPALDVYQMGLILVEMFTGEPAVNAQTRYDCFQIHCNGNINVPQALQDSVLGPVIDRALAVDHKQRYQDAGEFLEALHAVSDHFNSDALINAFNTLKNQSLATRLDRLKQMREEGTAPPPPKSDDVPLENGYPVFGEGAPVFGDPHGFDDEPFGEGAPVFGGGAPVFGAGSAPPSLQTGSGAKPFPTSNGDDNVATPNNPVASVDMSVPMRLYHDATPQKRQLPLAGLVVAGLTLVIVILLPPGGGDQERPSQ